MTEDDDWFERALQDADADSDAAESGESTDESDRDDGSEGIGGIDGIDDTGENGDGDDTGENGDTDDDGAAGGDAPESDDQPADPSADPFGGIRDGERDSSRDGDGEDPERGDGEPAANDDPFGGEQGGSDDPFGEEPTTGDEPPGGADPFGGGSFGEGDPFGDGSTPDDAPSPTDAPDQFDGSFGEGDPFGGAPDADGAPADMSASGPGGGSFGGGSSDPFGGYRGTAGGAGGDGGDFGEFGGGGDASGFDVDADELDSSIDRTNVGIDGLDEMILGGIPSRSLVSVIGGAGTGKTTFALQFLNEALESGGKGIYITLEQTRESILSTAEEKGWSFRDHAEADRLAVVAIDPIEMANSLASIRNDLIRLIADFGADRLVLDSVSLLEMMYDHPAKRRSEVFGFTRSLKEAGVTTLLTSEASEENAYASRHGIVEYLTDAVFVLQYIRGTDFRETRLAVEIQKIRDANHSRQSKPYDITDTGISVYGQANIF